jgi:diaminobutyrate-2-oxoglutarate transaminase
MGIFERVESEARSYCRAFPAVFVSANGSTLVDEEGRAYIDFLAGAGSLNYGHNHPQLKRRLMDYIASDGVTHSLDLHTSAKAGFLATFERQILQPRGFDYKVQFTGPTGTNAVEAALKIARRATGRQGIVAFTNGFHGVTLGSLAATANSYYRAAAGTPLEGVSFLPYDGYYGDGIDTSEHLARMIEDGSSGLELPAAVLLETVQGEGGINPASVEWMRSIARICNENDILLIVDDIQAGCGRTGTFFSFEPSGIVPDIVTLSKSLSGYGLPFATVLMRPELDLWKPGEHNGTFRGNNHAFITATAAIDEFWSDDVFEKIVQKRGELLRMRLISIASNEGGGHYSVRGRGMMQGLVCDSGELASAISADCFAHGLVIETSGADGQVVKCLPPLTTTEQEIERAMDILAEAVQAATRAMQFAPSQNGTGGHAR